MEQHAHWTTSGIGFYGDHLLFERLYKSAADNADLAAEKFLGLWGEEALDYQKQYDLIGKVMAKYQDLSEEPLKQTLAIEKDFLSFSEKVFKKLEKEGHMTLGLDDMIMQIASKREESVYLLQQTLSHLAEAS
jgi:DNA-binding ferritin-like protein